MSRSSFLFGVLALFCLAASAKELPTQTLLKRIEQSQQKLAAVELKISQESEQLNARLSAKQDTIAELRKRAASIQRAVDEQTLGYDTLQKRIEQWQAQSNYQNHLLAAYIESAAIPPALLPQENGEPRVDIESLAIAINQLKTRLQPNWQEGTVIAANGQVITASTLKLGPIEMAVAGKSAGLVQRKSPNEAQLLNLFGHEQQQSILQLHTAGRGYVLFDPTLGRALELINSKGSLWSHIENGGFWVFPIIVFGLLSFLIAVFKGVQLLRLPKVDQRVLKAVEHIASLPKEMADKQLDKLLHQIGTAQAQLVEIARRYPVSQHRDDLLVASLTEHRHHTEKYTGVIATSAAVAPLLGLLGTVSGMISTFKMMTIFGSGDASTVSGGISEALVTTELGLVVAIPSLIVSALLTRRTRAYAHQLENFAIQLSKQALPGGLGG